MYQTGPIGQGTVSVREVTRSFGDRRILHDVTLELGPGRIVGIVGSNGSGKSTLLRILAGILDPTSGSVEVAGAEAGRGQATFVCAGDRMLDWRLSGRANLTFFARVAGIGRDDVPAAIEVASESLGAGDLVDRRVGQLSTGQRRRLMLSVAFLIRAPVLLLDEPFEDLDREGREVVAAASSGWAAREGSSSSRLRTLAGSPRRTRCTPFVEECWGWGLEPTT